MQVTVLVHEPETIVPLCLAINWKTIPCSVNAHGYSPEFYSQYRMSSAKLRNHLKLRIGAEGLWIVYVIIFLPGPIVAQLLRF